MKTFIVDVCVDAESVERAEMIVNHCIEAGAITGCIAAEEGEVAVVLRNVEEARNARIMERAQALLIIGAAIESFEKGTWTVPELTKTILYTLKYLVEKEE